MKNDYILGELEKLNEKIEGLIISMRRRQKNVLINVSPFLMNLEKLASGDIARAVKAVLCFEGEFEPDAFSLSVEDYGAQDWLEFRITVDKEHVELLDPIAAKITDIFKGELT